MSKTEMYKKYNDALLLYSIFSTEEMDGSQIKNIIACSDMVNHAIMTYEEFYNSLTYLKKMKLVEEVDKKLFVKNEFKEWYNNKYKYKSRIYLSTIIENIIKQLDIINKTPETEITETEITGIDFENGINEYIKHV